MIVKTRKYHQSSSQKCIRILSKLFVKSNISGEHKFEKFSQLSTIGRRITCLVINLALGGRTKTTLEWLKEKRIISDSKYDERMVYDIIHHWRSSSEIFERNPRIHEITKSLGSDVSEGLIPDSPLLSL